MRAAAEGGGRGHTDIAALSAGVVAVVVSLFVSPGYFSVINFSISFTLIAVILAYVWGSARWWLQSLAVAAVIGLASMPGIGFIDETVQSRAPFQLLVGDYQWRCKDNAQDQDKDKYDPCDAKGDPESRVPNKHLAIGWLLVTALTFTIDRYRQGKYRSKSKGPLAVGTVSKVPDAPPAL
jgi:hypothetical protein